jgi:hypothetical protein
VTFDASGMKPHLKLWLVGVDVVGEDETLILMSAVVGTDHADGERWAHQTDGTREGGVCHCACDHGRSFLVEHAHSVI